MSLFQPAADREQSQFAQRVRCFPYSRLSAAERKHVSLCVPAILTKAELVRNCNEEQTFLHFGGELSERLRWPQLLVQGEYKIIWAFGLIPTQHEFEKRSASSPIWVEYRHTTLGCYVVLSFSRIHAGTWHEPTGNWPA